MSWRDKLARTANEILRPFDIKLVRASELTEAWRPLAPLRRHPAPGGITVPFSEPFIKGYCGSKIGSVQEPADFAVVMQTMLRPKIADAIRSIFEQQFAGSVQILIGIDVASLDPLEIDGICQLVPDRHSVLIFYPGYSTSRRYGGVSYAWDGGSLRIILSYLANSQYIAYLDDDNWWSDDHLASLHSTLLAGAEWAWAERSFVHPKSRQPICQDKWESIGPGKGFFSFLGGWVDPNCLAIDKIACEAVLRWWSIPRTNAMDADRNVFHMLRTQFEGAPTGRNTVFYEISEADSMHPYRLNMIGERRYRSFNRSD